MGGACDSAWYSVVIGWGLHDIVMFVAELIGVQNVMGGGYCSYMYDNV